MDFVPILPVLESKDKLQEFTISSLQKLFNEKYDYMPMYYVRVPGRVNLIGEHIDYCGFSVLPMALELDIVLAVGINSHKTLNLTNFDSKDYEDFSSSMEGLKIDKENHKWYNYFLCGVLGIMQECKIMSKGLDVAVKGTIPPSSGLSSSSALVCAAALAVTYGNRIPMSKTELAALCARSEHLIGTLGGGMDQAIAFLAEPGSAKLIDFNPLKTTNVTLPSGALFVVANCCVPMNKAQTSHYNTRVVECKLAAQILCKAYSLNPSTIEKLKDVVDQSDIPLSTVFSDIGKFIHEEPYNRKEVCNLLGITDEELEAKYLNENTRHLTEFKLYQRARHVLEEAFRVHLFRDVCGSESESNPLYKLGALMTDSHDSCRDLYECSHPDLDELVDVSLEAGAIGSRLTGAGWGGCCVSLVKKDNLVKFLEEVKTNYFMKTTHRKKLWQSSIFTTQPGSGAIVFTA